MADRDGFEYVQQVRLNKGPHKRFHRPGNVGQKRDISGLLESLYGVLRHLKVHLVQHDIL